MSIGLACSLADSSPALPESIRKLPRQRMPVSRGAPATTSNSYIPTTWLMPFPGLRRKRRRTKGDAWANDSAPLALVFAARLLPIVMPIHKITIRMSPTSVLKISVPVVNGWRPFMANVKVVGHDCSLIPSTSVRG